MPTFAAVQAWAGADRRARVVAAVNVLNAAFMAGSTVIVALLQTAGMTTSQLFVLLGVFRLRAWFASLIALVVALLVAIAVYGMPVGQSLLATSEGAAFGFFPILWIVGVFLPDKSPQPIT